MHMHRNPDPAAPSLALKVNGGDHRIVGLLDSLEATFDGAQLLPRLQDGCRPPSHSIVSAVEGLEPRYGLLLPLNRGVALRHDGLHVAVVEGLQHAANNVHVLPRHRPPSIPAATGGRVATDAAQPRRPPRRSA